MMLTDEDTRWLERPELGWESVHLPHEVLEGGFVSGDQSGRRLSVRYYVDRAASGLRAKVIYGPETQGPPGHAHGGSIAAVLDEAMGGAAWLLGHRAVAAGLTTQFRTMLPLRTRCIVEAWVVAVEGRKVDVAGALYRADRTLVADAQALFIEIDPVKLGTLASIADELMTPGKGRSP